MSEMIGSLYVPGFTFTIFAGFILLDIVPKTPTPKQRGKARGKKESEITLLVRDGISDALPSLRYML